ncbi:dethiobiotin synthase [Glaciecola siphonariae]|uniref:ATP-dependent dethiobiotin synthetase BioD n=1 Tax=Glaciecola siphonariae TaxID=521012 RepID=A0ABV9LTE9_9ALTE
MKSVFISGTDTDVGKTFVSRLLLQKLNKRGKRTIGFKPISAGCIETADGLRNDDALILQSASLIDAEYQHVNPIAFKPAIAPHIAAEEINQPLSLGDLQSHYEQIKQYNADLTLIEGAGGWRLPINNRGQFLSDFVIQNQIPVILVVGMRLGCLNHALLTHQAIENDQLDCVGWIANQLSCDMPYYEENLAALNKLLPAPMLAEVKFNSKPENTESSMLSTDAFDIAFDGSFS